MKPRKLNVAVISDVHLGTYNCHADELLKYLKSIDPKVLVINGDFVDFLELKRSAFPQKHFDVILEIIRKSKSGTKVYYLTGNHDESLRRISDFEFGNIEIKNKLVLELNGEKNWFFHGDVFDPLIEKTKCLAQLGSVGYDFLLFFNRQLNQFLGALGKPRMTLSQKIKKGIKIAHEHVDRFEETAVKFAAKKKYANVICGHIHMPNIKHYSA